ncbi:MAG: 30S ribosomal protein S4e [Promethearchaeota archaeon]
MPKGSRKHLKRLAAPGHWQIRRKEHPFTIRTSPGSHSLTESIPLAVVVRDMLNLTTTFKETRRVIARGAVKVDGIVRKNYKHPVGLMDVVEIPEIKVRYRMVPSSQHLLSIHSIPKGEVGVKLCKIVGKTTVVKGNVQLHLHDGRNVLVTVKDPKTKPEQEYNSGDTLLITIPKQGIQTRIPLKEGVTAIITGGVHTGFVGVLEKIDTEIKLGTIKGADGTTFQTALRYVFAIGEDKSLISLPEGS